MMLDIRVDPASLGDEQGLPLLLFDRLLWGRDPSRMSSVEVSTLRGWLEDWLRPESQP